MDGQAGDTWRKPPPDASRLRVFISYSRDDAAFAEELEGGLKLLGYEVFIDRLLSGGEVWKQSLAHHIGQADTIVFVLSPSSARSEMCHWEVEEATRLSKRILPVIARAVADEPVPERLRDLNYILFSDGRSFTRGLAELRDALDRNIDWIREHTRLADLSARWEAGGRSEDRLLPASEIAAAMAWLAGWARPSPPPTDPQRAYIAASDLASAARTSTARREIEERERLVREAEAAARDRESALQAAERAAAERDEERRRTRWIRMVVGTASALLSSITLAIIGYVAVSYLRFSDDGGRLQNADLLGGDILDFRRDRVTGNAIRNMPLWQCRMRCIFTQECIAITYDAADGLCYLKQEVGYFGYMVGWQGRSSEKRPARRRTGFAEHGGSSVDRPGVVSEILRWSSQAKPQLSSFFMMWDRQLVGSLVSREKVEVDPAFAGKFAVLQRNNKQHWRVAAVECQRRCHELGGGCQGFTYSLPYRHCELFAKLGGLARDSQTSFELSFPATYSGCRTRDCTQPGDDDPPTARP